MNATIRRPRRIAGTLRVPSDRSITVRAVLLGSIASGDCRIREPLDSDDTRAAIRCMTGLGTGISSSGGGSELVITGKGVRGLAAAAGALDCGSSGATIRLLAGLLSGQPFGSVLDGSTQLRMRPMRRVTDPLRQMGARVADRDGCAPVEIAKAELHGIEYTMPIPSAQVKSSILLAALYAAGRTTVIESAPTRDHTERLLSVCGVPVDRGGPLRHSASLSGPVNAITPFDLAVPADLSSAAFFLMAGLLHDDADVSLPGVGINPTRTGVLDVLAGMGAQVQSADGHMEGGEPVATLGACPARLRATTIGGDLVARAIDEFPIIAVAATQAAGTTIVRDAQELRVKESNRIDGMVGELRKLGARIEATPDGFVVDGPTRLHGAVVDGLGDHRVAMALAIAGLLADGETTILGAECVSKTYPTFFDDLRALVQT